MRLRTICAILFTLFPISAHALCIGIGVSATTVDFGTYDPSTPGPTTTQGTVTVQCTVGILTGLTVALSTGQGSYAQRTMKNGSNVLKYNLYIDGNYMTVWGDGTSGTMMQSFGALISLGSISYVVYGQAPKAQYPAKGAYNDPITVTVTF
jgi:spore coat protein U-like protein